MSHGADSILKTHKAYLVDLPVVAPTVELPVVGAVAKTTAKKKRKKEK